MLKLPRHAKVYTEVTPDGERCVFHMQDLNDWDEDDGSESSDAPGTNSPSPSRLARSLCLKVLLGPGASAPRDGLQAVAVCLLPAPRRPSRCRLHHACWHSTGGHAACRGGGGGARSAGGRHSGAFFVPRLGRLPHPHRVSPLPCR